MQHGYSHYHYDPHYDKVPLDKENLDNENSCGTPEQPCWKKDTKLSRLKFRRNAVATINSEHKAFLRSLDDDCNTRNSSIASIKSEKSATDCNRSSALAAAAYFPSNTSTSRVLPHDALNTKPPPVIDSQANVSVLTPLERQGLARHQHRNLRTMSPMDDSMERHHQSNNNKNLFEMKKGRRHTLAVTDNSKLNFLRHMLTKRLACGENIKVMKLNFPSSIFLRKYIHPGYLWKNYGSISAHPSLSVHSFELSPKFSDLYYS